MQVALIHDDSSNDDDVNRRERRRRAEPALTMLRDDAPNPLNSPVVEQILQAATEAVADRGLGGLSMEDIALRARCSRATVYRRVGGKEAIRDAVVREAVARITTAVTSAVEHLTGEHRVVSVIRASLEIIRADPVCAALLTGSATAATVNSALISECSTIVAEVSGLNLGDHVGCELISRATLALLAWPAADSATELAIIRRLISPFDPQEREVPVNTSAVASTKEQRSRSPSRQIVRTFAAKPSTTALEAKTYD
jgi:AcrR family transcriptional regulator